MASTGTNRLPRDFILTPQQQNLLFRALTSNQPANGSPENSNNAVSLSPASVNQSPQQTNGAQESPLLDYDYDFGPNDSFDFDFANDSQGQLIGDIPDANGDGGDESKSNSPENDSSDKRSHPDEDDDDEEEEGGNKRRDSGSKVPKKPGRKPLTNEPSSKRKAQNRAAQRAFRERKEKHLKDLETKVEELEKASQVTSSENNQLRAKVEKMTVELNEYKKRLSYMNNSTRSVSGSSLPSSGMSAARFGSPILNQLNDVNFQFEFPKFGVLPGPNKNSYPSPQSTGKAAGQSVQSDAAKDNASPGSIKSRENSDAQQTKEALAAFSGIFNASPYDTTVPGSASRTSLDSGNPSISGTIAASPSSSSNSNMGPSSSCGTSPEPFTQSPAAFKPVDTLTTIGEEQTSLTSDALSNLNSFGTLDVNNFDWLAQQNGGQFDPQLFGDYREPQQNILANPAFDDSFFNDAFDIDFTTPFNMAPSPNAPKKNLIAEIDARKENEDTLVPSINGKLLTCNNIWEKLQTCPKVQSGDLDLDGLCSDLQKKAKCGGSGAVVDEHDFKAVMKKYLGGDGPCPSEAN